MQWNQAMARVATVELAGVQGDVTGVEYDSRRVGRGDVFVAMRGGVADGNRFVESAIAQGAAGVVTDSREMYDRLPNTGFIAVRGGSSWLIEPVLALEG